MHQANSIDPLDFLRCGVVNAQNCGVSLISSRVDFTVAGDDNHHAAYRLIWENAPDQDDACQVYCWYVSQQL